MFLPAGQGREYQVVGLSFLSMRPNLASWWGGGLLSYQSVVVLSATYKILYTGGNDDYRTRPIQCRKGIWQFI